MREEKYIPLSELKVGMEIQGYKSGNTTTCYRRKIVTIKDNTVSFDWGEALNNASEYLFAIYMTNEELRKKYNTEIEELKEALNHDLGQVDGYHEMWNSWLYSSDNLAQMASELKQNKLRIVGYATLTVPKHSMFSDNVLDIGVVAEYEDGERIWCHTSNEHRKRLLADEGEDDEE